MSLDTDFAQGSVWFVDLNPTRGHEQAKKRPCVIISDNKFNKSSAGLLIVLPLTSKNKKIPWHVEVLPPEGGLKVVSYAMCDQIRTISKQRLSSEKLGSIRFDTLKLIQARVKILLSLFD